MKYFVHKELSAYGCRADDFLSDENKVVLADESDDFLWMLCFGNAVITKANKQIYDWCKSFVSKHEGFRCFDGTQMAEISRELIKYNYLISSGQGALPDMTIKRAAPITDFNIQIFRENEIENVFNSIDQSEWGMFEPSEAPSLAVAALDKDKIVGVSYADGETDKLWSIGIEVLPEYRQKGLAVALTMEMTNHLLNRNIIPFATGAWSNTGARTALFKCGYYPAWSQMDNMNLR
jgi:GNAT superfamily N-acetyltransferase